MKPRLIRYRQGQFLLLTTLIILSGAPAWAEAPAGKSVVVSPVAIEDSGASGSVSVTTVEMDKKEMALLDELLQPDEVKKPERAAEAVPCDPGARSCRSAPQ